ncbi:MAG: hypothetical protein M0Q88_07665 [Bacilli bacterium]|nr:hypothetical protein [Bacilli bacterium]
MHTKNKSQIKVKLVVLFLLAFAIPLFGSTIAEVLPNLTTNQIENLRKENQLRGISFKEDINQLVPINSLAEKHLTEYLNKDDSFTVIALNFIPFPKQMESMGEFEKQLFIFNTMRSISTQEGITYISHRAGNKEKLLIEKSWYLETPKSRSGIDDPFSYNVPKEDTYYVYQRDSSFGSNIYQHDYETSDKEIFVKVTNLEKVKVFSIFTAVKKEQLSIAMDTYLLDDGILLTAMATIEGRKPQIKVMGITVDLPSAFNRRITALGDWFVDQLSK